MCFVGVLWDITLMVYKLIYASQRNTKHYECKRAVQEIFFRVLLLNVFTVIKQTKVLNVTHKPLA